MTLDASLLLLVEDELPIRRFLKTSLAAEGYRLAEAETGEQALRLAAQQPPDLVILDLGLPDMDGQEVLQRLREWLQAPIIILSARDQEREKIIAPRRRRGRLRRPNLSARANSWRGSASPCATAPKRATQNHRPIVYGDLRIDLAAHRVFVKDAEVHLTALEFKLLATLVRHAGKVLTHRFLLKEVWGPAPSARDALLESVHGELAAQDRRRFRSTPLPADGARRRLSFGLRLKWSFPYHGV